MTATPDLPLSSAPPAPTTRPSAPAGVAEALREFDIIIGSEILYAPEARQCGGGP